MAYVTYCISILHRSVNIFLRLFRPNFIYVWWEKLHYLVIDLWERQKEKKKPTREIVWAGLYLGCLVTSLGRQSHKV